MSSCVAGSHRWFRAPPRAGLSCGVAPSRSRNHYGCTQAARDLGGCGRAANNVGDAYISRGRIGSHSALHSPADFSSNFISLVKIGVTVSAQRGQARIGAGDWWAALGMSGSGEPGAAGVRVRYRRA